MTIKKSDNWEWSDDRNNQIWCVYMHLRNTIIKKSNFRLDLFWSRHIYSDSLLLSSAHVWVTLVFYYFNYLHMHRCKKNKANQINLYPCIKASESWLEIQRLLIQLLTIRLLLLFDKTFFIRLYCLHDHFNNIRSTEIG